MLFLADAMLGRLARDLRLLGYDVAYHPDEDDTALLHRARREGRLLLTKDRELARRGGPDALLVEAPAAQGELDEVVAKLRLAPAKDAFLSRCTACGGILEEADAAQVQGLPEGVAERHPRLSRCAGCGRAYWPGTHVPRIEERLRRHLR